MRYLLWWVISTIAIISCSHPQQPQPVAGWQNLDLENDGIFGISTEKAYAELLRNVKSVTTIVAVIDSGIDTSLEDLTPVIWTDPVNGSHGCNYILPETGKEDFIPVLERGKDSPGYQRTFADYNLHVTRLHNFIARLKESKRQLEGIRTNIGRENPSLSDFRSYRPRDTGEATVVGLVLDRMPAYPDFKSFRFAEVDHLLDLGQYHLAHGLSQANADTVTGYPVKDTDNVNGDVRNHVGNDPLGLVADPNVAPEHGTYMAGIIAAVRKNSKGIDGIADNTRIISLKLYNNIREMRNDNLADAIRFAVDHGARVVSMSFGKTFSWHRSAVDEAVRYAMSRGVLLVHSSGNDGMDLDADGNSFFPSPQYLDGGTASAWITVGASGFLDDVSLAPDFSNYGHRSVDVFAPGVQITGLKPRLGFATYDGTSQAGAVVAGLAALIMEYYPTLTAVQVKDIILRSVVKRTALKDKCISGGVVNAYNALQLAAGYSHSPDQHDRTSF